jgi:hypothetical protein
MNLARAASFTGLAAGAAAGVGRRVIVMMFN